LRKTRKAYCKKTRTNNVLLIGELIMINPVANISEGKLFNTTPVPILF
jgi:hypothetical protein